MTYLGCKIVRKPILGVGAYYDAYFKDRFIGYAMNFEDCKHRIEEYLSFITDEEKMIDFKDLTKEEFLASYSYLTEEEYDATVKCLKRKDN